VGPLPVGTLLAHQHADAESVITWGFRLRRRRVEGSVQYWIDRHQRLSQKLASVG